MERLIREVEYWIRPVDEYGDSIEILFYDTIDEAL
jgi:hypothetical protein